MYATPATMSSARDLLRRKERLGRVASYQVLADAAGCSRTTAYQALKEIDTGVQFDRDKILGRIADTLDTLESKVKEQSPAG